MPIMSLVKENASQEMIRLFNDANHCQNLLYTLQVKSKEIQTIIQHDIGSMNLNIDFISLSQICTKRKPFENLLNNLATLKEELLAAKAALVEECKHSTINKQKFSIEKLKALENILFYKSIQVKWASAALIEQLKLRKRLAQALSVSNMIKLQTFHLGASLYRKGTSTPASLLLTELKNMEIEFTTLVLKFKLSNLQCNNFTTKTPPSDPIVNPFASNHGTTNVSGRRIRRPIRRSTTNATTTNTTTTNSTPTNATTTNTTTTNSTPTNATTTNATTRNGATTNAATKSATTTYATATNAATTNADTTKAATTNAATNHLNLIGTNHVRFAPLHGIEETITGPLTFKDSVNYQCITFMKEYENKSLEELRLEDYNQAAADGRKYSPVFALPQDQLKNIGFFYAKSEINLPSCNELSTVRYKLPMVTILKTSEEEGYESDSLENLMLNFQCITCRPVYESVSLEELRLADYYVAHNNNTSYVHTCLLNIPTRELMPTKKYLTNVFFDAAIYNAQWESIASAGRFVPHTETESIFTKGVEKTVKVNFQCITLMKEHESKSFEEIRLDDYITGRSRVTSCKLIFPPKYSVRAPKGFTSVTSRVSFTPLRDYNMGEKVNQCITFMPEYKNKSLEEYRLTDYIEASGEGKTYDVFALSEAQLKKIQFFYATSLNAKQRVPEIKYSFYLLTGTDEIVKSGVSEKVYVVYQTITCAKEFDDRSLEEIRLDDYVAGRNNPAYKRISPLRKDAISLYKKAPYTWSGSRETPEKTQATKAPYTWSGSRETPEKTQATKAPDTWSGSRETPEKTQATKAPDTWSGSRETPEKTQATKAPDTWSGSRETPEKTQATKAPYTWSGSRQTPEKTQATKAPYTWSGSRETPEKTQATGRDSQKPTRDTPTPKSQTFGGDSSTPTRETPTKNSQTSGGNPFTPQRESPTQKFRPSCRDSSPSEDIFWRSFTSERNGPKETEKPPTRNQASDRDASTNPDTRASEVYERDIKIASEALELINPNDIGALTERANAYYYLKKYKQALEDAQKAAALNPNLKTSHLLVIKCCLKLGDITRAEQALKGATIWFGERNFRDEIRELKELREKQEKVRKPKPTRDTPTPKSQTFGGDSSGETPTKNQASDRDASTHPETHASEVYERDIKIASEALELINSNDIGALTKRANAYYYLRNYKQALEDAQKAAALDPNLKTSHLLVIKCCLKLGDITRAEQAVKRATELFGERNVRDEIRELKELREKQEKARKLMDLEKYYDALDIINECLKLYCPSCYKTKLMKAECLANNGKCQEAQDIAINLSLFERYDADAIYVVGLCLHKQNKDDQAKEHFRKVINLDPDHKKAARMYKIAKNRCDTKLLLDKKNEGTKAYNDGDYEKALELYNNTLPLAKDNVEEKAKLYYNIACAYAKLNQTMEAEQACTVALDFNQDYIKALERRALCCTELGEHEDAVQDYKKLIQLYKQKNFVNDEIKRLLSQAEKVLEKFKKTNYHYKILGLDSKADDSKIKQAYRQLSLLNHPDKIKVRPEEAKNGVDERAARRFRKIKEAYDALYDVNNSRKRANYDRWQKDDDDDDDEDDNNYDNDYDSDDYE